MLPPEQFEKAMQAIDAYEKWKKTVSDIYAMLEKETDPARRESILADLDVIERQEIEASERRIDEGIEKIEDYALSNEISLEKIIELRRSIGSEEAEKLINLAIKEGMRIEKPSEKTNGAGVLFPFARRNGRAPKNGA